MDIIEVMNKEIELRREKIRAAQKQGIREALKLREQRKGIWTTKNEIYLLQVCKTCGGKIVL